jgi:hypothetical protein
MFALPIISVASTLIGGVVSFMGAQQQASAAQASANYQAQVAKNNAKIAEDNAAYSRQAGVAETEREGMKTAQVVGAELAGQSASGIDLTTGSPTDVVRGTREGARLSTLNLMQNAELRARGYNIEASNQQAEAGLATMRGRQAATAGTVGGFSSLLGGATSFADKWMKFQSEGVGGGLF